MEYLGGESALAVIPNLLWIFYSSEPESSPSREGYAMHNGLEFVIRLVCTFRWPRLFA